MRPDKRTGPANGADPRSPGRRTDTEGNTPSLFDDGAAPDPWTHRLHGITADKADGQRAALSALNVGVREKLDQAIARRAATGVPFTSDDLHDDLAGDVLPHDGASMGAVVNAAARAGLIVECGYVKSRRPEARSRRIVQWVGAEVGR